MKRTAMARIEIRIASRVAVVTDRLLTKHRSKVNRVAGPDEDRGFDFCHHDRLCRRRIARAKRAESHPGRCRSGEVDSDFAGTAGRLDGRKSPRLERRRRWIQNHERASRL